MAVQFRSSLVSLVALLTTALVAQAQPFHNVQIAVDHFHLVAPGDGSGTITFSGLSLGTVNGQPWAGQPISFQLAPLSIAGFAPMVMGPGQTNQVNFHMVSTPLPGGLIANPQFGGQSSFTVVPSFAQTHSAPVGEWGGSPGSNVVTGDISFPVENGIDASPIVPVDTAIVDPTPGGLLDPGAHMLTIWGDLFLDSDSSLSNWRAFDLDAGGGLLTLMLYSTDPNANWSDILASGGELTGFGILNLTGVALNESTGGQIPEPATVALWLALGTAGVYWHRRHRRA